MAKGLSGKKAVVTGGGSGIGRMVARRLASSGALVYLNDISATHAEKVAAEIEADGDQAVVVVGDMGSEEDIKRLFATVAREDGKLDILVTQAGTVSWPEFAHVPEDLDPKEWERLMAADQTLAFGCYLGAEDFHFMQQVNLHGTFYCCCEAIPLLRAAGGGRIVTMSSAGGGISSHFAHPYGVAKGAVVGMTRALALQLLPDNIIVNCISQGTIDAGIWDRVREDDPAMWERDWTTEGEGDTRTIRPTPSNRLPVQRLGRPSEVAELVAFLVSDEASYLVGQNFNLSGGLLVP